MRWKLISENWTQSTLTHTALLQLPNKYSSNLPSKVLYSYKTWSACWVTVFHYLDIVLESSIQANSQYVLKPWSGPPSWSLFFLAASAFLGSSNQAWTSIQRNAENIFLLFFLAFNRPSFWEAIYSNHIFYTNTILVYVICYGKKIILEIFFGMLFRCLKGKFVNHYIL